MCAGRILIRTYFYVRAPCEMYEQREQLDCGGGGTLSQGAGQDGSFYRYAVAIAVQKRAVQFTKKPFS